MTALLQDAAIFFLGLALVLYSLFGGTALGAGVLELVAGEAGRKAVGRAVDTRWELHHGWLVLIIAILFAGFPPIFYAVEQHLFIPLYLTVAGIVLRTGAASYRFFNPAGERGMVGRIYDRVYRYSSLMAAFFIGVTVGAAIAGRITRDPATFYEGYVAPWLNGFSMLVGLFTVCLFGFLAAVYALAEAHTERERDVMARSAKGLTLAAILSGGFVFLSGELSDVYLLSRFAYSPGAIVSVLLSAVLLPFLWHSITRRRIRQSRILAGAELVMVLIAWFDVQNPVAVSVRRGANITFAESAAPETTLLWLVVVLAAGTAVAVGWAVKKVRRLTADGRREG